MTRPGYDITFDRVEAAMLYMAETDLEYAQAVADYESAEIRRKRVRARVFLDSTGTAGERQAQAETSPESEAADSEYTAALLRKEQLKARRQRAELVIDLWRTLEASRRKAA